MPSLKVVRQSLVAKVVVRKHVYKVNGRKKKEKKIRTNGKAFSQTCEKAKNQNKQKSFSATLQKSQKSEQTEKAN